MDSQPFTVPVEAIDDNDLVKHELIDLRSNNQLKIKFEAVDIDIFWCVVAATHPTLGKWASTVLVPFLTTYLCDTGFSTMVQMKGQVLTTCMLPCPKLPLALLI